MEIDITEFYQRNAADASKFSPSSAELGDEAGVITWLNALEEARERPIINYAANPLLAYRTFQAYREHLSGYGAWDGEEIDNFSGVELNAMLIQEISAEIRERNLSRLYFDSNRNAYYAIGD